MDDFEFDKVILRNIMVLDTLMTYFDKGIVGQPELKMNLIITLGVMLSKLALEKPVNLK